MTTWVEDIGGGLVNANRVFSLNIVHAGETEAGADRYAVKAYSAHFSPVWVSSGYLTYQEAKALMSRLARLLALPHDADMVITQDALKEGDES